MKIMFIEMQRGRSFGGLVRYCMGPGEADIEDRVSFVQMLNLATRNPEAAWRVMASRYYLQDEMKAKHGIRTGARGKPVGHLLISWGAEEALAQKLDQEGMMKAAHGALKAIGAEQHQAIVIAHNDTQDRNPHCHIIINLISDDGRLKDNTEEKKKLSRFALEHETAVLGEPVVKRRYQNWQDRDAGEKPAPVKKKARHLYELEKAAECDAVPSSLAGEVLREQKAIEQAKVKLEQRCNEHQATLLKCRDERISRLEASTEATMRAARTNVRKNHRPLWEELYDKQLEARLKFESNERSIQGSLNNIVTLIDWNSSSRFGKLSQLFSLVVSEKQRREAIAKRQQEERVAFRKLQREKEKTAQDQALEDNRQQKKKIGERYWAKLKGMKERQEKLKSKLDERQRALTKQRDQALLVYRERHAERKRQRSEERQYLEALLQMQQADGREEKETKSGEGGQETSGQTRSRKPRDITQSRRKRQQKGETREAYRERISRLGISHEKER